MTTNYESFASEVELEDALSRPTDALIRFVSKLEGDILLLGVSGKMGVSMACMARRACMEAGVAKRVIGVSRFGFAANRDYLERRGVETLPGDLLDARFVASLPPVANVVFLAGTKFGTEGTEAFTWATNAYLPGIVADHFRASRIVALSTGCVYPLVDVGSAGSAETDPACPVGEYAQSCLGRERIFEYSSRRHGTQVALIRLNYAVEMRYGVLVDVATRVWTDEAVHLGMGYANVIWQGDANALILQALGHCQSPARIINVTGPEKLSIREVAGRFGELLGRTPNFAGTEHPTALLTDASWMLGHLGRPAVAPEQVMRWIAAWVSGGGSLLGKPTHFEVRDGKY